VRPGRTARRTDVGQGVAARHGLADANGEALVMAIARDEAIAMADFDHVAVAGLLSRKRHDSRGHGHDIGTLGAREIDALVERLVSRKRILALTEIRGDM